jgi:hypothetical protein
MRPIFRTRSKNVVVLSFSNSWWIETFCCGDLFAVCVLFWEDQGRIKKIFRHHFARHLRDFYKKNEATNEISLHSHSTADVPLHCTYVPNQPVSMRRRRTGIMHVVHVVVKTWQTMIWSGKNLSRFVMNALLVNKRCDWRFQALDKAENLPMERWETEGLIISGERHTPFLQRQPMPVRVAKAKSPKQHFQNGARGSRTPVHEREPVDSFPTGFGFERFCFCSLGNGRAVWKWTNNWKYFHVRPSTVCMDEHDAKRTSGFLQLVFPVHEPIWLLPYGCLVI